MTPDWHLLRVELVGGPVEIDRPPGRDFPIGSDHTFGGLADAIDTAFARWDLSHLHEFTLADGRRIGMPDPDDEGLIDEETETVTAVVGRVTCSPMSSTSVTTGSIGAGSWRSTSTPRRSGRRSPRTGAGDGVGRDPRPVRARGARRRVNPDVRRRR